MSYKNEERSRLAKARYQRGITIWGLLYVLITLGLIALVLIKSLPVYINAYDIRRTLEGVAADPQMQQAGAVEIQRSIQRHFDAGYVDNVNGRDVAVKRTEGGGRELSISYEVRRPLLFNAAMVYSFDEHVRLAGGDGG